MSRVVSKKLRDTREEKNLTLDDVSAATHIRVRYLEAMERGEFDTLPSQLQVKGFIRSYGGYLGLNTETLLEALELDPWAALDVVKEGSDSVKPLQETTETGSDEAFRSIGKQLQAQREALGLSLDEVFQHTHLRLRYLTALETGEIEDLPSTVQGRGMLKNYASFLGLDPEKLLLEYADGLQARLVRPTPKVAEKPAGRSPTVPRRERSFLSRDVILGSLLGLFLVLFIIWGTIQVTSMQGADNLEPTPPSIAEVLNPSQTPSQIPTTTATQPSLLDENARTGDIEERPVTELTQEVVLISDLVDGPVQVQIAAQLRAWMRITVDGEVEFDGRIIPGTTYGFSGRDYVEITTGNGAGLLVFYNDQDLGLLGNLGEVVNFVININGVQTPTPTITLTPTPTITGTPEPSPTPTPE